MYYYAIASLHSQQKSQQFYESCNFNINNTTIMLLLVFFSFNQQLHIKITPLSYNLCNYLKMNSLYSFGFSKEKCEL